jgi:hypothetical protein
MNDMLEPLSLDLLPQHSRWPARILAAPQDQPQFQKSHAAIYREYEQDKWGPLLEQVRTGAAGLDEVERLQFGTQQRIPVSRGDALYLADALQARVLLAGHLADALAGLAGPGDTVVELGAGTGAITLRLAQDPRQAGCRFMAADFSPSSVQLMDLLAQRCGVALQTGAFDFHAPQAGLAIPPGSVLLTSWSAAYVQGMDVEFWRRLAALQPRALLLAEPVYQHYREDTVLGLLRRRYYEINDYNRAILPTLQQAVEQGVWRIEAVRENVFGVNPLCPVSLLTLRTGAA